MAGGGMSIEMWRAEDEHVAELSELQQAIFDEFTWKPGLDAADLTVSIEGRIATLAGTVKTFPERIAAEQSACRVHGLTEVRNEIVVVPPESRKQTDQQLARTVGWAIETDARVPRGRIDATVTCGWVTLAGEVAWPHERRAVEETVQRLTAVRGVTNRIVVRPEVNGRDPRPRVEEALRRNPILHGDHIRVALLGTVVVLRGRVRSLMERDEALNAARAVSGVTGVRDELEVSS